MLRLRDAALLLVLLLSIYQHSLVRLSALRLQPAFYLQLSVQPYQPSQPVIIDIDKDGSSEIVFIDRDRKLKVLLNNYSWYYSLRSLFPVAL
jgi:hypothetical protein